MKFQVGQLVYMCGYRGNWGVVKAVRRPSREVIVLVRWVEHREPRGLPEDWMWAREMRIIEKGLLK